MKNKLLSVVTILGIIALLAIPEKIKAVHIILAAPLFVLLIAQIRQIFSANKPPAE